MHLPIKVKSPNNIRKWQMGFNSAFKGLIILLVYLLYCKKLPNTFLSAVYTDAYGLD
jgi:hypothetical protein